MLPPSIRRLLLGEASFRRDVLWNVAGLGVVATSGILVNITILVFLGSEPLGSFNQAFAVYIIVTQLAVGGLQFSVLRHVSQAQDDPVACHAYTSAALVLVTLVAVPLAALLYSSCHAIGNALDSQAVAQGVADVAPGLVFYALNKVLLMAVNGMRHMRAVAIFQSSRAMLILGGVLAVILAEVDSAHLPLALTLAEAVLLLTLYIYVALRMFPLTLWPTTSVRACFKQHRSFASRGMFSGILIEMNTRVDVLMLGFFMSDVRVGIYSFASTFAEGFAQLNVVIRNNVDPIVGRAFAERKVVDIQNLANRVKCVFVPVMGALGLAATAVFPVLIWLFDKRNIGYDGWGVFGILVTGIVLASIYRPFFSILLLGDRPGTFTLLIGASVLGNVVLNALLIPMLGLYGAAIATACIYILEGLSISILARRLFKIQL
jgi:O-antigen/teichoic acid export membrane protein